MKDEIIHDLLRLGLNEKEALVYVVALEQGTASAQSIAEKTGFPRASCYDILTSLGRQGLVTAFVEGGERAYSAEPAERLLAVVELQQRELSHRMHIAGSLVPRLEALHNTTAKKPRMRYIEGLEGLRNMQREFETYDNDILQLVGYDAFLALHDKAMSEEHRAIAERRNQRVRMMYVTDKEIDFSAYPHIDARRVSPSMVSTTGEMSVCGNHVLLLSYAQGIIAIDIESSAIASVCMATLELAWKEAEKIDRTLRGAQTTKADG